MVYFSGVKILDDFIISVALDQRVSLLRWKYNSGILAVNVVMQFATSIPDIHGLQAWLTPQLVLNVYLFIYLLLLFCKGNCKRKIALISSPCFKNTIY